MKTRPSESSLPLSPECSHPSQSIASAVFVSMPSPMYPSITCRPRKQISPCVQVTQQSAQMVMSAERRWCVERQQQPCCRHVNCPLGWPLCFYGDFIHTNKNDDCIQNAHLLTNRYVLVFGIAVDLQLCLGRGSQDSNLAAWQRMPNWTDLPTNLINLCSWPVRSTIWENIWLTIDCLLVQLIVLRNSWRLVYLRIWLTLLTDCAVSIRFLTDWFNGVLRFQAGLRDLGVST